MNQLLKAQKQIFLIVKYQCPSLLTRTNRKTLLHQFRTTIVLTCHRDLKYEIFFFGWLGKGSRITEALNIKGSCAKRCNVLAFKWSQLLVSTQFDLNVTRGLFILWRTIGYLNPAGG